MTKPTVSAVEGVTDNYAIQNTKVTFSCSVDEVTVRDTSDIRLIMNVNEGTYKRNLEFGKRSTTAMGGGTGPPK
jgi:hypothetical protein